MIETLFWYLWDKPDIQTEFVTFCLQQIQSHLQLQEAQKAKDLLEMLVHDIFLEPTA